ncbi:GntR family transcriptional regulator [Glycomyces paridis]|uniref:GntR family transcriptional regulator n=1 Tax=Glycomyces paridis TaxID=2126555 RepID=A0A4S8PAB8_9ACTN|nr:GntR family transcriptional regulator [Glycomyces paridis]THV26671.1 GntR family transcriptional regulator [Glycomyces paridis]
MGEMQVWPERQTLADEAYTELKSRIIQSILEPGAKLSIDGLAKHMAISQTPIREALARLEVEGLVERRPLSGYTVTPLLTGPEFEDLFELRLLMEPLAASRAAEQAGRTGHDHGLGDFGVLRGLAETPDFGADAKLSRLAFTEADERFHAAVARFSLSPVLAKAIRRLDAHLHLHRAYIEPEAIGETEAEHLAVAAAIIAVKPLAAEEAMRRHLEHSRVRHRAAFAAAAAAGTPAAKPKRAKAAR